MKCCGTWSDVSEGANTGLGLVGSATPFGFLFGAVLAGVLGVRIGRKRVMLISLDVYAFTAWRRRCPHPTRCNQRSCTRRATHIMPDLTRLAELISSLLIAVRHALSFNQSGE